MKSISRGSLLSVLPTPRQLKGYKRRPHRFKIGEEYRECKCRKCEEWLPMDTEFFSARINNGSIVSLTICRACAEEARDR